MDATKPQEQRQLLSGNDSAGEENSTQRNALDRRYGKIGISAVAAAVRCKGDEPRKSAPKSVPLAESFDSD